MFVEEFAELDDAVLDPEAVFNYSAPAGDVEKQAEAKRMGKRRRVGDD